MDAQHAVESQGLADEVLARLEGWCKRFPAMGGLRLESMALACAAACPRAPAEDVLELAIFCMVLFGIDDLGDRALCEVTDEEIDQELRHLAALAHRGGEAPGELAGPAGQVRRALAELCARLAAGRPERPAYRLFARCFEEMLDGMREEVGISRAFAERGELPGWDAYLEIGTRSVGIPPVGGVMLVLERPHAAALGADVDALLNAAARCIRFANDLRSFAREALELKPNSVTLLMRNGGATEAQARAEISARCEAEWAALPRLAEALPAELRPWAADFVRYTGFIKRWYAVAELHEAAPALHDDHGVQKGRSS